MLAKRIATQIRLDPEIYVKIKSLAKLERRFVNNQIEFILDRFVQDYEQKNGPIPILNDDDDDDET